MNGSFHRYLVQLGIVGFHDNVSTDEIPKTFFVPEPVHHLLDRFHDEQIHFRRDAEHTQYPDLLAVASTC